jgi:hypothetical protein
MKSNIGSPFISNFEPDEALDWQMSRAEKYCLINLLEHKKPNTALEIGTYKGGSLQVLAKFSSTVYSIDISNAPKKFLEYKFPRVNYIVGKSYEILPSIFREIEEKGQKLEFILVDGDHSTEAVHNDLTCILEYPHKNPLTIVLHDSFNPQCRKGIESIDYEKYRHVKYIELDYIGGSYWHNDTYREMWGGLAVILIDPNGSYSTEIGSSLDKMYKRVFWGSIHIIRDPLLSLAPIKHKIFDFLKLKRRTSKYESFDD